MKLGIGLLLLSIVYVVPAATPQRYGPYCHRAQPDDKDPNTSCYCLSYHPDLCDDENGPIPSCCKAAEKDAKGQPKVKGCMCCSSKKAATIAERGWFIHQRDADDIVEYKIH